MEMEVHIGRRPKSLHERDGAALALVDAVIPSHAAVQAEESPDKDAQYRGHHLRVIGQTVAQGEGDTRWMPAFPQIPIVFSSRSCLGRLSAR